MKSHPLRNRVFGLLFVSIVLMALATIVSTACGSGESLDGSVPSGGDTVPTEVSDHEGAGDNHDAAVVHEDEHESDIVEVTLNVVEGRPWRFEPAVVEVSVGHRIKLTLVNDGLAVHDIEIAGVPAEDIEVVSGETHAAETGHHSELVVAAHAEPGSTATVLFTPTEAGEYEFACTLPGHREAGMVGKLVVTP